MKIVVRARHMAVTDDIRKRVESKAEKLSRYFGDIQTIEVTLDIEADKPFVEIIATARKKTIFVATSREDDMTACIDHCFHKISEQIRRHKDKVRDRQGPPHSETMDTSGD